MVGGDMCSHVSHAALQSDTQRLVIRRVFAAQCPQFDGVCLTNPFNPSNDLFFVFHVVFDEHEVMCPLQAQSHARTLLGNQQRPIPFERFQCLDPRRLRGLARNRRKVEPFRQIPNHARVLGADHRRSLFEDALDLLYLFAFFRRNVWHAVDLPQMGDPMDVVRRVDQFHKLLDRLTALWALVRVLL